MPHSIHSAEISDTRKPPRRNEDVYRAVASSITKAQRFRANAHDCIAMSECLPEPMRSTLLDLADAWSELAFEVEESDRARALRSIRSILH